MKVSSRLAVGGFSLIEIVIVLGIASFALVALMGLSSLALNTTQESARNLEAASVASQLALRWTSMVEYNAEPNTTTLAVLPANFPIPITLPDKNVEKTADDIFINDSGLTTSVAADQTFRLKYSIRRSSDNPQMVRIYLRLSWPAQGYSAAVDSRSRYDLISGAILGPGV